MKALILGLILFPFFLSAQDYIIKEGVPEDLKEYKIIFFKHEPIKVTANPDGNSQEKFIHLRQTNHNNVIEEANTKLVVAAQEYPFGYAISTKSAYEPLLKAGYKYILTSKAYEYTHVSKQPDEDILIVFEYFIQDLTSNVAYKVFELDEMKVYDSKLMIRRLNKAIKKGYPEAFD